MAAQRAQARSQISNPSANANPNLTNKLVSQSLDPMKLQMAKRKASNDDSRFKNIHGRYGVHHPNTQNLMAPFLDQSLDIANHSRDRPTLAKQPGSKEKSRQETATALTGEPGRPKTSSGMRGNGIFHKMGGTTEEGHSILPPQQNNLPTKSNFSTLQKTSNSNHLAKSQVEKNENLRG